MPLGSSGGSALAEAHFPLLTFFARSWHLLMIHSKGTLDLGMGERCRVGIPNVAPTIVQRLNNI